MDSSDDILLEFILEAREILDRLDIDFVALEKDASNEKLIANIFRAIHTLKGSSGFFAFKRLEKISHAGESLLGKIRDGQLTLDEMKTNKLLEALDVLRELIEGIEASKIEPSGDDAQLIKDLLILASGGELVTSAVSNSQALYPNGALTPPKSDAAGMSQELMTHSAQTIELANASSQIKEYSSNIEHIRSGEISAPVRVNLEVLDKLMNLVGEMVLARNRLLPFTNQYSDENFSSAVRNIDLLTLELQERMMKIRMQPIAQLWSKFPRLIRDVSHECGKNVQLVQEGGDTELDKSLIDAIRDPLVHLIRNSIDHSIEMPEARIAAGKNSAATLGLRAKHEKGMVVIEIADDGAGINYELIRKRIVDKNFVDESAASRLTDSELIDYLFLPGFSTKSVITHLSGRGVGMDVVKNNITNIGGSIEIFSPRGQGTTVRLKIPLTLAIIPALIVGCDGESYAIPQVSILELVKLDLSIEENGIEDFYGVKVFRLREKLVPLLFLSERLDVDKKECLGEAALNIAILQSNDVRFGLVVDKIFNIQDVVVKPLDPLLKGVPNFSGATLLGSGRVALILDVDGIAAGADLAAKSQEIPAHAIHTTPEIQSEEVAMLLFDLAGGHRMAIPLDLVERIAGIDEGEIQKNGNREVVHYSNEIMHLIRVGEYIDGTKTARGEAGALPVIIPRASSGLIGLAVECIHDIAFVSKHLHIANPPQKGIAGCALLDDLIINVIDLDEILVMRNMRDGPKPYPEVIDVNVWH